MVPFNKLIDWFKKSWQWVKSVLALHKRVEALEKMLSEELPPEFCKRCGKRAARCDYVSSPQKNGVRMEMWKCADCGFRYDKDVKPKS
jgi:hypothetical protein